MQHLQLLKTLVALAAAGFNPRAFIPGLDIGRTTPTENEGFPARDMPERR